MLGVEHSPGSAPSHLCTWRSQQQHPSTQPPPAPSRQPHVTCSHPHLLALGLLPSGCWMPPPGLPPLSLSELDHPVARLRPTASAGGGRGSCCGRAAGRAARRAAAPMAAA